MKKVVHQVVFLNLPILVLGVRSCNESILENPKYMHNAHVLFVNGKPIGSLLFFNKKILKVPKCEIFDSSDFHYFYTTMYKATLKID
jgi:hypothetical protein